jgi:hypothetical protein
MHTKHRFLRTITIAFIFCVAMYGSSARCQSAFAETNLLLPAEPYAVSFYWLADSVNSKLEPHTAILIPVKLKDCPRLFYMQFDLGSPYSVFYKNKLTAIQLKYPKAMRLSQSHDKLINFSFKMEDIRVLAKEIAIKQFDSSNIDWKNKKNMEIIGTIGADLIDGKTVVIDYPKKKLIIAPSIPAKLLPHLSLADFMYERRSVLLPAKIQGKQIMLYFDTGSSMYELLTDKKTCEALAMPGAGFIQSKVTSWDKFLTANSIASNSQIEISGINIPIHHATYIEGVSSSQIEKMMKMGIGGMTGNKIFLDYILVLDTKNKKFAVSSSQYTDALYPVP